MKPLHARTIPVQMIIICFVTLLVTISLFPSPVAALPPRPDGNGETTSAGDGSANGDNGSRGDEWARANGAYIELHVQPIQSGLWTAVQWQDSTGDWLDVDGWQGLIEGDQKTWWVSRADLGKGPFRWVVFADGTKAHLLGSQEFYLPQNVGEIAKVEVLLQQSVVEPSPVASLTPTALPISTVTDASSGQLVETVSEPKSTSAQTSQPAQITQPALPASSNVAVTTSSTLRALPSPVATSTPVPPLTATQISANPPPGSTVATGIPLPADTPEPQSAVVTSLKTESVEASLPLTMLLSQTVSMLSVEPGQEVTWTLTLRNPTSEVAKEVILSDMPAPDLIYLGSSASQGEVEVLGEPPIIVAYLGDVAPGDQVDIDIYTGIPTNSLPGAMYPNFATYSANNAQAGISNQLKVMVQTLDTKEVQTPSIVNNLLNPFTLPGQIIWAALIVFLVGLVGWGYRQIIRNKVAKKISTTATES